MGAGGAGGNLAPTGPTVGGGGCPSGYHVLIPPRPRAWSFTTGTGFFHEKKNTYERIELIVNGCMIYQENELWWRICPECGTKISYSRQHNADYADKHNTKCIKCVKIGRTFSAELKQRFSQKMKEHWENKKNGIFITSLLGGKVYYNDNGVWCRKCPTCKREVEYRRKDSAVWSEEHNCSCVSCTRHKTAKTLSKYYTPKISPKKHIHVDGVYLNEKKQWCRKCPSADCGREIDYTTKYWANKAQREGNECYVCYSNRVVSGVEQSFLDYFNITERQKQIGAFIVDGIKGKTIFEFLGDFWHGNPNVYDHNNPKTVVSGKTYKQLYNETVERFQKLQNQGYNIKFIWESDWKQFEKDKLLDNSKFKLFNGVDLLT